MENKKWSREEAEQNKNKILEELKELPTSENNLEWVTKELNQLIDEEELRQEMISIPKNLIINTPNDSELGEKVRAYYNKL
jgi:hypothetical protein